MSNDPPSFTSNRKAFGSNETYTWGGSDGESWSTAVQAKNGVKVGLGVVTSGDFREELTMTDKQQEAATTSSSEFDAVFSTNGAEARENSGYWSGTLELEFEWANQIDLTGVSEIVADYELLSGTDDNQLYETELFVDGESIGLYDYGNGITASDYGISVPVDKQDVNRTLTVVHRASPGGTGQWIGSLAIDNIRPDIFQQDGANI